MGTPSFTEADAQAAAKGWWLFVLIGMLGIVAGIIVLVEPGISLVTLAVVSGIFLLVNGVIEVVLAFMGKQEDRALTAIFGVIAVVIGVILVRHPIHGVVAIALLLGIFLLVSGVARLIMVFATRSVWQAVLAILEIIAGIVIVSSPGIGVSTLAVLVGIAFILRGMAGVALGFALRTLGNGGGTTPPAAPAVA